jgi:hypothetical protein
VALVKRTETSVFITRITRRPTPEENSLHCYRRENIPEDRGLQSYIISEHVHLEISGFHGGDNEE